MIPEVHLLFLLKYLAIFLLGALIGTLWVDLDHFIPYIFVGEPVGSEIGRDKTWLHRLYWVVLLFGVLFGFMIHLFFDLLYYSPELRWFF